VKLGVNWMVSLFFAMMLASGSALAAPAFSRAQYIEAKKQVLTLEQDLKWELVSLKIAMLMNNPHPQLVNFIDQKKIEIAQLESEIVHYKGKILEWEQENQRTQTLAANRCAQKADMPLSAKAIQILKSTREIVEKMKWQSSVKLAGEKKLLEIRESTLHYLNQSAYVVLLNGKEIVKVFKFNNVGVKELATSRTTLVKNGVHITYQEGKSLPGTAYIAQVAYLEEIPLTRDILLKLGPAISYQIGDRQKNISRGSMAVLGPKIQLHIKSKYFIGMDSGLGIRFATSWIRDLIKNRTQGTGTANEIMFQFGMVFPG